MDLKKLQIAKIVSNCQERAKKAEFVKMAKWI